MMTYLNKTRGLHLWGIFIFTGFFNSFSFAQSNEPANKKAQGPLIIQSQIKGAQEQPNVMYILPWQGIENPILIDGKSKQIVLPKFNPINPKKFKNQVRLFHQQGLTKEKIK